MKRKQPPEDLAGVMARVTKTFDQTTHIELEIDDEIRIALERHGETVGNATVGKPRTLSWVIAQAIWRYYNAVS